MTISGGSGWFAITFSLFLLMDPIGNIPIYLVVLKEIPPHRQRMIIIRELLISLLIMILFSFVGEGLLRILAIDHRTVLVSGGVILFLIAIRMVFPESKSSFSNLSGAGEPLIVPLAIPLVAGPSVLAAVMIYSRQESHPVLLAGISMAWFVSAMILLSASTLKRILGERGMLACERLMGLLLTLMSVQMFLEGLSPHFTPLSSTSG